MKTVVPFIASFNVERKDDDEDDSQEN